MFFRLNIFAEEEVKNEQAYRIQFTYDGRGFLSEVIDSVGRRLEVTTNEVGRMTEVALLDGIRREVLVRYAYNKAQDLVEIADALGQSTQILYHNHLMAQKIDRNQNSFYWRYDGPTTGARVIKTWGDGNVLAGELAYYEGYNEITDSLGHKSLYYFNEDNLCTKIVHPDGSEETSIYNDDFELLQQIDEDGRMTTFSYDEWANPVMVTLADGRTIISKYDEKDRLIETVDAEGGSRQWIYNEDSTLQENILEDGTTTVFSYNENHLIETVTNAQGHMVNLGYDDDLNLSQVTLPDGTSSTWIYDRRGNCTTTTNPLGAQEKYSYDTLNRLVRAHLSDGNDVRLQYNAYEDVILAKDNHTEVAFDYTILGSLTSRKQGGKHVQFTYDTEEQLTAVINEKGETYAFERDSKGNIRQEIGFDGLTKTYDRSPAGLVEKIHRPANRWTVYQHDPLGNVIRADYYDDTWETYGYDKNGLLVETENAHTKITLERDLAGQVIKEAQNDEWIASSYDELGNRLQITSSLGANIDVERNIMGNVSQITASRAEQQWTAAMQYNELGQEIERILPGNLINEWQYDSTGRPTNHRVSNEKRHLRRKVYHWDVNHRLKSMVNELTAGKTTYGYDEFSNLIWSNEGKPLDYLYRNVDDVGNLYETRDKTDRIYGAGSRLLETKDAKFSYDEEGNLIEKVEENGDVWQYAYFGNGMMSKVIKPDDTEVTFKYDSLGRRIEKSSDDKTTHFVWDGNTILHEYCLENDLVELENQIESQNNSKLPSNLVTWVFNDGFVPSAKITNEGSYSIISDYLGTPVEAYDEQGKKVWSAALDIYGRVKEYTGEQDFIPFRYQGQYEDLEIGLYYNRFRYYDPEQGNYTQIDPIGLAGGNPTLYGYVHDANIEVDPFGLARAPSQVLAGNRKKAGDKTSGFQAHHVIPTNIWKQYKTFFDDIGMAGLRDEAFNGIMIPSNPDTLKNSSFNFIHNTQHPLYNSHVMNEIEGIFKDFDADIIDEEGARGKVRKQQMNLKNQLLMGNFNTVQSKRYPKCKRLG